VCTLYHSVDMWDVQFRRPTGNGKVYFVSQRGFQRSKSLGDRIVMWGTLDFGWAMVRASAPQTMWLRHAGSRPADGGTVSVWA
jgi:hypothetical protein